MKTIKIHFRYNYFLPREEWPEYDITSTIASFLHPRKEKEWISYGMWPLYMSVYFGDKEPTLLSKKYIWPHVFVWDRESDVMPKKQKWYRAGSGPRKQIGVLEVRDENYMTAWSDTAKYERRKWTQYAHEYEVEEIDAEIFFDAYRKSATYLHMKKDVRNLALESAKKRVQSAKLELHFLIMREKESGEIRAGLVYELASTSPNTYYSIGFIHSYNEKIPFMTRLISEWIERERARGYVWFNFGAFWKKGDPLSWKGYSEFKQKFGVKLLPFPPSLIRIRWFW